MQNQLHLVANAAVTSGGEGLAALRYAESIAYAGCMVTLLSKNLSDNSADESSDRGSFDQQIAPTRKNFLIELLDQYKFMQRLCGQKKFSLIHLHGMWTPFLALGALVARRRGIPVAISPHGSLEAWALRYKLRKKWFALKVYQGAVLRSSSFFIATSNQELESIRKLGLRQPVAVIPNGVDVDASPRRDTRKSIRTILFLSRINPKKGLLDLVAAWGLVRRSGWRILIAGGDEDGHLAKVTDLIRAKNLQADFEFVGFVEGTRKQACFDVADVFILPTYSENFGIAVAEALANELPVITTTGAPWQDLVDHRCGWWVTPGVEGISAALNEAMACESEELRQMGCRGRQLVIDKFSWNKIGLAALEVSEWSLDVSQKKPDMVFEYEQMNSDK